MAMRGRGAVAGLGLTILLSGAARAADPAKPTKPPASEAPAPAPVSAPAAPPPTDTPAESATRAEVQAAAAQRAAQELEAQVIELRRTLEAMDRQRASFDDVRRRLDELEARMSEDERRDAAAPGGPREAGAIRFRDEGVIIRSPNNRFQLRPQVRIQALYEGAVVDKGPADTYGTDRSGFALTHAEVILEGHAVSPRFEYRLQLDAAEAQPINDAFVQFRALRSLAIRAGQFKVPFGLQRQVWSGELELTDISSAMAAFSLERDVGVEVLGRPLAGRLLYQLAMINGSGSGQPNDNVDLAYAARIVAAPFGPLPVWEGDVEGTANPRVSGGISGSYNLRRTDAQVHDPSASIDIDANGKIDNIAVWQGGVELRAVWRGASLQAEGFGRLERPGAAGPDRKFWGGYVQASYFILPGRLQVAGRLSRTDLPVFGIPDAVQAARGTSVDEQTVGVGSYLRGHHAKAQVEYTHLAAHDALSMPDTHRVRAAIQLWF
jgi:hypothetical protein